MIGGDILLMAAFIFDLFTWQDIGAGADLFLTAFLAADALMSMDYIRTLNRQDQVRQDQKEEEMRLRAIREEKELSRRQNRMDQEMAESIRSSRRLEDMSVEELRDLLRQKESVYEKAER